MKHILLSLDAEKAFYERQREHFYSWHVPHELPFFFHSAAERSATVYSSGGFLLMSCAVFVHNTVLMQSGPLECQVISYSFTSNNINPFCITES